MFRIVALAILICGPSIGCFTFDEDKNLQTVSHNPFDVFAAPKGLGKVNVTPASQEVALRVDWVGRKILAENPQIGLKPLFTTAGVSKEEIFHPDQNWVVITEGLVKHCKDEGELAAILSLELAKMVAEREAVASPQTRKPEQRLPATVPIGNAGQFTGQDQTALAELARYEKDNPKKTTALSRPNPQTLARIYLEKAGYQKADLDRAEALLQTAERNCELERQFKGLPPQSNWTP